MKIAERIAIVGAFGLMLWLLWGMATASVEWYEIQYGKGDRVTAAQDRGPEPRPDRGVRLRAVEGDQVASISRG